MKFLNNRFICLTYDSEVHPDGIGAQTIRIYSIYTLSKRFRVNYLHTGITDFAEPFVNNWSSQNSNKKTRTLNVYNRKFGLESTCNFKFKKAYSIRKLTYRRLIKHWLISAIRRKPTLLRVVLVPKQKISEQIIQEIQKNFEVVGKPTQQKVIVVQIRNAEPRYGIPDRRNLNMTYYFELLNYIRSNLETSQQEYCIKILVDLPISPTVLRIADIPQDKLWMLSLSAQEIQRGFVIYDGLDYKTTFFSSDNRVEVFQSTDPIEAVEVMRKADFLIMSRSSFSCVGGLLNKSGIVIEPPDWVYLQRNSWIRASNLIEISREWRVARYPIIYNFIPHSMMNVMKRILVRRLASRFL